MISRLIVYKQKKLLSKYIRAYIEERSITPLNVIEIDPDNKILTIDDIRFLQKTLATHIPKERLFVIYSFELASIVIQNALLKTLEEKSERNSVFISTTNPESTLPTIRSRMQLVYVDKDQEDFLLQEEVKGYDVLYEQLKEGYHFMGNPLLSTTKEDSIVFLDKLTLYLRNKMRMATSVQFAHCIKAIFKTKEQIIYSNATPQLALDNLLISIHKTVSMK
ncbi:hypothetical protein COY90_05165 [Candidatus Roizmanbacteria bacterium CG_4_10_14_0_8_um_filter_39_9]|uniref:DNA polymerase III delta N-terminal domain-containing protein n=1 Tax=Candidatus Roizmanbacteria bacterium CG_4_10_14_0_8_um_filter_39_9 TaxID=1974829 RepID=A0A2M7QBI8_9BACT|nr:MAG: hypothetical protein COY90_05165 [Candidatus Roizmanbacteria bacterium CG_4_10_14_0_8_um_filter_39_9]